MAAATPMQLCGFLLTLLHLVAPSTLLLDGTTEEVACPASQPSADTAAQAGDRTASPAAALQHEHLLLQIPAKASPHGLMQAPGSSTKPAPAQALAEQPDNSTEQTLAQINSSDSASAKWWWWHRPRGTTTTPRPRGTTMTPRPALAVRFATFNVFWKLSDKPGRIEGVSTAIVNLNADIAVITELWSWNGKGELLAKVREKSGKNYIFCTRGSFQDKAWDGDILYDADKWEALDDGVDNLGQERGMSWGVMQHKGTQKKLLVYGMHPLCCGHELEHLQNAKQLGNHLQARPEHASTPAVVMGDFNAVPSEVSMRLYKGESVNAFGRRWTLPMSFETTGNMRDATHNSGGRIDYILIERRQPSAFQVTRSWVVRNAPGNSDHYPVVTDVMLY